jgi:hypothetical protein
VLKGGLRWDREGDPGGRLVLVGHRNLHVGNKTARTVLPWDATDGTGFDTGEAAAGPVRLPVPVPVPAPAPALTSPAPALAPALAPAPGTKTGSTHRRVRNSRQRFPYMLTVNQAFHEAYDAIVEVSRWVGGSVGE